MSWSPIVLGPGEGEKLLFKTGLMTFKASSAMTGDQFMIAETELPPGVSIPPHSHPEAEVFYILRGAFEFRVGDMEQPHVCTEGAIVCVPPHVIHAFQNRLDSSGKILGMMLPGGGSGLEGFFRQIGVPVRRGDEQPDMNQPADQLLQDIAQRRLSIS